jgi:hypothetical protein
MLFVRSKNRVIRLAPRPALFDFLPELDDPVTLPRSGGLVTLCDIANYIARLRSPSITRSDGECRSAAVARGRATQAKRWLARIGLRYALYPSGVSTPTPGKKRAKKYKVV